MAKLCKCGCRQEIIIKWWHKYRGIPDFIHGHNFCYAPPMLGRKVSKETRKKLRESRLGIPSGTKGLKRTEETRKKMRKAHKQWIENISIGNKDKVVSPESRKKMSIAKKGMRPSPATEFTSEGLKAKYRDPTYVRKMAKAWNIKPNKPETLILKLLDDLYPGEWKYTGDFSFTINGKNPDFVNCNGQKKIIEFNGTHWHKNDIPGEREKIFAEFGYDTLIIWDTEMKDMNAVIDRIHKFNGVI